MPKRVHRKRMSKRGGDINKFLQGTQNTISGVGNSIAAGAEKLGQGAVELTTGAYNKTTGLLGNVDADKKPQDGEKSNGSWFGSWFDAAPASSCPPCPPTNATVVAPAVAAQSAGSRRRKRSGRKSKNMFSGLMKMVGFKTKKRGRKGGIGGPSNGYEHIVGANFPSAANAQGNTIYDLAPFDPLKPFTGGMKGAMKGGCMPSKFIPLSPAPFPGDGMIGGKSKRHRKRRGGTKKWCTWK